MKIYISGFDCECHVRNAGIAQMLKYSLKFWQTGRTGLVTSLVHGDQVGFIRGRNGADNIRRLINIMWSVADTDCPVAAISLDKEKAFNCVEWEYLFETLKKFGFGNVFLK